MIRTLLILALGCVAWSADPVMIPAKAPADALADPSDLIPWPEKPYPHFAADSVVNATWLLDAPAGKHGRATAGPDGRLHFADGSPARFWGTTTAFGASFPETREDVIALADALAATGYNALRFHHNDLPRDGLGYVQGKPAVDNGALDPAMIDRLDFFASELYKRGIYIYVDLVDSRQLTAEDLAGIDDVQQMKGNGGWKGLFPHPSIVAAWKRAATALLDHVNPYTKHRWADEPGVMAVEVLNENGLFWDWSFKTSPQVGKWFDGQWNAWLTRRYGDRAGLAKRWTDAAGTCGLFDDEDPAAGTVYRPPPTPLLEWDRPFRSKTRGAARANDYNAFLAELSTGFYREATAHLRALGYAGVVVGSHELRGPLNQKAEVDGTGTIAAHLYANPRLAWGARPGSKGVIMEGVDVKSKNWFSNLQRIKVVGAPGINGEWTGASASYRADVNFGVSAAMAFQRVDASLHFTYAHRWTKMPMPDHDTLFDWKDYLKAMAMTYTSIHDAPWMAINRPAAALFVRGDLARAKVRVEFADSDEDVHEQNLHAVGIDGGDGSMGGGAQFLSMLHEVDTRFFGSVYDGDADIAYATGRSASGDYSKAKHAVLIGDNPWIDRWHQQRDLGAQAKLVRPGVRVVDVAGPIEFTIGAPWKEPKKLSFASYEGAIEKASLPAGAMPIGESADGKLVLGWLDDRFLVLPGGRAFDGAIGDVRWLLRLHLAACARWKLPTGGTDPDGTTYITDTGEMAIDWAHGILAVDTPRTQGFTGLSGLRTANATSRLSVTLSAPYGNVVVTSADGKPLAESARMLLVACGRVQNTGQELDAKGAISKTGTAPLFVEGLRGTVSLKVNTGLAVYALDCGGRRLGAVETRVDGDRLAFDLSPKWRSIWFEIAAKDPTVASAAGWPAGETARTAAPVMPKQIPLADFLAMINAGGSDAPGNAPGDAPAAAGGERIAIANPSAYKPFQGYGNMNAKVIADGLEITFGKKTKDWSGGAWFPVTATTGPGTALVVRMKGDGTKPREFYIAYKTKVGGFRSRNLSTLFEDDSLRDVTLTPADFTAEKKDGSVVDFSGIEQVSVSCVGPLMDTRSIATFAGFWVVTAPVKADAAPAVPDAALPAPQVPAKAELTIPFIGDAVITADGDPSEPAWQKSLGFAIDEDHVPPWHFTGTHVGTGTRKPGEVVRCWLLGTEAGLAMVTVVDKNGAPRITADDWFRNDCVELFSDVGATGGKPTRQLFLAWGHPGQDRAQAADPAVAVGRAQTAKGYRLEAMIPWQALGFAGVPDKPFGLDLQVDISRADGSAVQLVYATGTNEAWVSSQRYLRCTLSR